MREESRYTFRHRLHTSAIAHLQTIVHSNRQWSPNGCSQPASFVACDDAMQVILWPR